MPIGLFTNVSAEFNPEVGPGRFLRLWSGAAGYTGDGYAPQGAPGASYLQASIDIESGWADIHNFMAQLAESIDLPPSALRLDYSEAPSGISIIIRAFPLLTRARQRRPIYQWAETDLAKLILRCIGNHYSKPETLKAADTLKLLLSWPEPRIPIPGPERDQNDDWEMALGIKSRVDCCQERFGLTEEQAIQRIEEVAEEEAQVAALLPNRATPGELHPGMVEANGQAEKQNGYYQEQAAEKDKEVEGE
jgi:hypothetical protein